MENAYNDGKIIIRQVRRSVRVRVKLFCQQTLYKVGTSSTDDMKQSLF